ncbi:MAG: TetR/AcrR family transcriptional regulator [Polyangiaceae bacterium]|nr:TetR/AcrR family transcriptional regulator [Polyangiaceae bacterium]
MARPKEFDRDEALKAAMNLFWEKGYEATTTDDLRHAMSIGRQSLYDTFGNKHRLFLEALALYSTESGATFGSTLEETPSALAGIKRILMAVPAQTPAARARGCMFVNTASEMSGKDDEIDCVVHATTTRGEEQFERAVRRAQAAGEIREDVDARAAGRFLFSTLQGLRLTAKAGASPATLRDIATMALHAIGCV